MRLFVAMLLAGAAFGQTAKSFDVASVKPANCARGADFRLYPGGRLHITCLTINVILRRAYNLEHYQISGGPAWLGTDDFDIEAKSEGDPPNEEMLAMLRALLADRFQLKVRLETREQNVYALSVAKDGHKLKPPTGDRSFVRLIRYDPPTQPGVHYALDGKKANLALIALNLGQQMGRPVIDRTGIEGEYDFKVDFAIDDNPESGAPLMTAIQQQLGLKLESTKGPVETLVVEHAEKPTAN
jgi:uncharacterized protein (TIGR03435 family)